MLCSKDISKEIDWSYKGNRYSHLRFADDTVLIHSNITEFQKMASDISDQTATVRMKVNKKTKILSNTNSSTNIKLNDQTLEIVAEIINLDCLWKTLHEFKLELRNTLKRILYNQCILPVLTHRQSQSTWCLTKTKKL